MSHTVRVLNCSPDRVFAVLADGWLFPSWVVGASRMRDVDDRWPHVGAQLHHSFGVWPALIDDATTSLRWDPPRSFVIQPKGWPIGEARVAIDVEPRAGGCEVHIREQAVKGPGTLVPVWLLDLGLHIRNIETLRRLAYLAEGGAGGEHIVAAAEPTQEDITSAEAPERSAGAKALSAAVVLAPIALLVAFVRRR
ncbi:MAG TPA: SRPBCC family protein [Plantibacter sp.]|uniref:SRPBCC family protein n=1 Tax=unclassified Plantibacter TaxID=2624265 RepID=UPI002C4AC313|nr:SRPBCC family protein [Plantibacter sp.]